MTDIKSLAERIRDCTKEITPADRHGILKLIDQQAARIAELEARLEAQEAEPYAYELHLPNDEYSLVYAGYLAKYATEEERECDRLALYADPVADSAMAKDAERYRWLRNEHFPTADNPPLAQVVWKEFDNRHGNLWANMIDGNDLDRAIDSALAASEPKNTGN